MPIYDLDAMMNHSHEGETPIFSATIPDIIDEDKIMSSKNTLSSSVSIYVYKGEGMFIPHFHFICKNPRIDCCIMLMDNRYFTHGPHSDIISDGKTRKNLEKWLNGRCENSDTPDLKLNGMLTWSAMVKCWNYGNGTNYPYDESIKSNLDYSHIKPYK